MTERLSITAVREHMRSLWELVLRARLPPTWVPIPVKRALAEAIVASVYTVLSGRGPRVPVTRVYQVARALGLEDDEAAPRPGESGAEWWLRVTRRREDETASEWIDRVTLLALAAIPFIIGGTVSLETHAYPEAAITYDEEGEGGGEAWL